MKRLQKIATLFRNRRAIRQALSTLASLYADDGFFDSLGSLADDETAALVRWCCEGAASGKPFTAVEIGTLFGFTAAAIARATPPNVRIIAVDNFCWNPLALPPSHHESFARRVLAGPLADGKVALFVGTSAAWRASNAPVPDLIFLDGDHSYKAAKEECLWARGAGVRYVCGHDWGHASFGVTEAVREVLGAPEEVVGMCWLKRLGSGTAS